MRVEIALPSGRLITFSVPPALLINRLASWILSRVLSGATHVQVNLTESQRRQIRMLFHTLSQNYPDLVVADIELHDSTRIRLLPR